MSSSRDYLHFTLEQLAGLEGLRWRAMMGEYVLYVQDKVVGGVYDDRLLVKPTAAAMAMLPDAARELPYEGAREMLLVDRMEDAAFLKTLLAAVAAELPAPKRRRT